MKPSLIYLIAAFVGGFLGLAYKSLPKTGTKQETKKCLTEATFDQSGRLFGLPIHGNYYSSGSYHNRP
jgi:hypothetical protein